MKLFAEQELDPKLPALDKTKVKSKFLSTGSFAPENILTNFDLENTIDTSNEWIVTRTGIKERRVADDETLTSDLAAEAGRAALKNAGLDASKIDLLILATSTPDRMTPSTAAVVQNKLGIADCIAFDLSAGCSGFMYALDMADGMIRKGSVRHALIIGAELLSKHLNWEDRSSCVLFGDGAGAAVLGAEADTPDRLYLMNIGNQAAEQENLVMASFHGKEERHQHIMMNGKVVFKTAVERIANSSKDVLRNLNLQSEDIKYFVCHQANLRIVDAVGKKLGLTDAQVPVNVGEYGNTGAASIPILLDELNQQGKLQRGDTIMIAAFGAGFTWGSGIISW